MREYAKTDGTEQGWLWICDSAAEKEQAKKAIENSKYFYLPKTGMNADGWQSTGFRTDGGATKLVDVRWSLGDGREYSQEEILNLAKEAIDARKNKALM